MKRVPAILLSAILAGLPMILFSYRSATPNEVDAQIVSWMVMGAMVSLGLGMVVSQTVWKTLPNEDKGGVALAVMFASYIVSGVACLAMWVFPLSALPVYLLITMATYALVRPFMDLWRAPK